eukprot:g1652.t1
MGATPSNARLREFVSEIDRWPAFKERTCLTSSDISGIAAAFRKAIEHSEGDSLVRTDFEHWLEMGEKPTPAQGRLFDVFLVTCNDEQISLYDFVVGLLNYCVDGKEYLSRLAFDVYDRHTTGTITEADLEGMLIDVWGPNWEGEELATGLLAERAGKDPMQPQEWEGFCRAYPNLLHPIYKLQRTLQDFTIGKKRWAKVGERLKKRKQKKEAEHQQMMRDALTEEEKMKTMQAIRNDETEACILSGSKCERMVATRQAANDARDGVGGGLLPGIAVRTAAHKGPSMSTLARSMEVRDRLEAVKRRSAALGTDPINWDENPLKRKSSSNPKPVEDGEVPKFSIPSRKLKGVDLAEDGEDGNGFKSTSAITPGSNGTSRSLLGSPSNSTQRQDPTLADTVNVVSSAGGDDKRGSVGGSQRIGGGHTYAGSTMGSAASGGRSARSSEASDPRSTSKVDRPNSGELSRTRSVSAMNTRKVSSPTNMSATAGSGSERKTSVAMAALTHRPSIATKSGKSPSAALSAGAAKRSSVTAYRETKKDLLASHRKASQQGVGGGGGRKPSRAVVAAGS